MLTVIPCREKNWLRDTLSLLTTNLCKTNKITLHFVDEDTEVLQRSKQWPRSPGWRRGSELGCKLRLLTQIQRGQGRKSAGRLLRARCCALARPQIRSSPERKSLGQGRAVRMWRTGNGASWGFPSPPMPAAPGAQQKGRRAGSVDCRSRPAPASGLLLGSHSRHSPGSQFPLHSGHQGGMRS